MKLLNRCWRPKVFIALFLTVSGVNTVLSLMSDSTPFVVISSAATGIIGTTYLVVLCRKISSLQSSYKNNNRPPIVYYDSETSAILNEIAIIERKKEAETSRVHIKEK